MLKPKPRIVPLEEDMWRALMQEILIAGRKKISIVKNMVSLSLDEHICAGLYTFILEEFGKLILLAACPIMNNKREIKYAGEFGEFTNHERKFGAALDYLEANGFEEAYILNNEGSCDPKSFSWRSFTIGQLVDLEPRLSLLYSDLEEDSKTGSVVISKAPLIDRNFLKIAITTFEKAINAYSLPP